MKSFLCAFVLVFNLCPMLFIIIHLASTDNLWSAVVCLCSFATTLSLVMLNLSEMETDEKARRKEISL